VVAAATWHIVFLDTLHALLLGLITTALLSGVLMFILGAAMVARSAGVVAGVAGATGCDLAGLASGDVSLSDAFLRAGGEYPTAVASHVGAGAAGSGSVGGVDACAHGAGFSLSIPGLPDSAGVSGVAVRACVVERRRAAS